MHGLRGSRDKDPYLKLWGSYTPEECCSTCREQSLATFIAYSHTNKPVSWWNCGCALPGDAERKGYVDDAEATTGKYNWVSAQDMVV